MNIGYCLEHGIGTLPDARTAVRWYRTAVRQGGDAHAMWLLADCLARGAGTRRDPAGAARLRAAAAARGVCEAPRLPAAVCVGAAAATAAARLAGLQRHGTPGGTTEKGAAAKDKNVDASPA